eukprot:3881232-Pyramimonas_sp.AAC.1
MTTPNIRGDITPEMLIKHQLETFHNYSFAYLLFSREGIVTTYPSALPLYWHLLWLTSRWVAHVHGISIDPSSVVCRTRPDIHIKR